MLSVYKLSDVWTGKDFSDWLVYLHNVERYSMIGSQTSEDTYVDRVAQYLPIEASVYDFLLAIIPLSFAFTGIGSLLLTYSFSIGVLAAATTSLTVVIYGLFINPPTALQSDNPPTTESSFPSAPTDQSDVPSDSGATPVTLDDPVPTSDPDHDPDLDLDGPSPDSTPDSSPVTAQPNPSPNDSEVNA